MSRLIFCRELKHVGCEIGIFFVVLLLGQIVIDVEIKSVGNIDSFFINPFFENEFNFVTDTERLCGLWQIFSYSFIESDKVLQKLLVMCSI